MIYICIYFPSFLTSIELNLNSTATPLQRQETLEAIYIEENDMACEFHNISYLTHVHTVNNLWSNESLKNIIIIFFACTCLKFT